jgi:cadmium resistance protein CadD (predicted permease)
MIQSIVTSIVAFVSTNLDDLFVLMLFYGSGMYKSVNIVAGQYLGIAVLVVIAFAVSLTGEFFDTRYIGLLGLFPIYLAMKNVYATFRTRGEEDEQTKLPENGSFFAIAIVTIGNGGDNVGVYVPLLASINYAEKVFFVVIFLLMVALWCGTAKFLANHGMIAKALKKYAHIALPIFLFLLGLFIIIDLRTLSLFSDNL